MRKILVLLFLMIVIPSTGCQSMGPFFKDRGNDFADCFKGDVGYGIGLGAHVRITDLVSLGVGGGVMWKFGFKGRHTGNWKDIHIGWPFATYVIIYNISGDSSGCGDACGDMLNDAEEGALLIILAPTNLAYIGLKPEVWPSITGRSSGESALYVDGGYSTESILGINYALFFPDSLTKRPVAINAFDIEFGVFLGPVGVHYGFSPGQFVDFILGWFGADIANDDQYVGKRQSDFRE